MSHGLLGASLAAAGSVHREQLVPYAAVGGAAALTPDLDLLIRSAADPILTLEYHRAFSHSLGFSLVLATLLALAWRPWMKRRLRFQAVFILSLIGILSHVLLDGITTFGTEMLWPFSTERIASSSIAVFDPFFTVPLAILLIASLRRGSSRYNHAAVGWAVVYATIGAFQHARAIDAGTQLAAARNHVPTRLLAIPSLGSSLLWKTLYEANGRFYVDAVRTGLAAATYVGTDIATLDVQAGFPSLDPTSQQARDIERFTRVADGLVAIDPEYHDRIVDLRYSLVPNEIAGFWAIVVDPDVTPAAHVGFVGTRENAPAEATRLLTMLLSPP